MDFRATKTDGQREDEEAERLIRPLPKKKPPRHDKRRERMELDRDPDVDGDPDLKGDPDLSMNYKTIGGSMVHRVAKKSQTKKVKVRRKEDGQVTEVTEETLRERGGDFEKVEDSTESQEQTGGTEALLSERVKKDPGFASRLKHLVDPTSDLGGLAEGNPGYPASILDKDLPPDIKTLGDLKQLAQKLLAPKVKEKGKKGPDKAPEAPPQKTPEDAPPTEVDKGAPTEEKPEEPKEKPPEKPEKSEKKKQPKEKPGPTRRVPSASEVASARRLVVDTFPPRLAGRFIEMHPDDIKSLVSNYNEFNSLGPINPKDIESEIAKAGKWSLDPNSIKPPESIKVDGKDVKLADLPEEEQTEAIQRHRMAVMGAQLAVRSRAISSMKKSGVPTKMAAKMTDFLLSTNGMPPEKRVEKAKEKAKELFVQASADSSMAAIDPRFGTPKTGPEKWKATKEGSRARVLSTLKDPLSKMLAVAAFQGEDYRRVVADHFGRSAKSPITDKDSPKVIFEKVKQAEDYFNKQSKNYPAELRAGLEDPSALFRVRVRHAVSNMDRKKGKELSNYLAKLDVSAYDDALREFKKSQKEFDKRLEKWKQSGQQGDAPIPPKPPVKPPEYDSVKPPNAKETRNKLDELLGVKKASFSSYLPNVYDALLARLGGDQQDRNGSRGVAAASQAEDIMTVKFAQEDADRILTRLDKMAAFIQSNHSKWGMSFETAKGLVNDLDRTADEIEKAANGSESFERRQVEVLKEAKVIQQDSDEKYMGTFNAPMAPKQTDSDEGYMSQFKDDQSVAVVDGKSTSGRPLAP